MNTANAENRKKLDQYFTPPWVVKALLHYEEIPKYMDIGEPCAGDGAIVKVLESRGYSVISSEIDPEIDSDPTATIHHGIDFLSAEGRDLYENHVDWVITNPPYSCSAGTAAQIFKRATEIADNVAMLLRLAWLEPCADRVNLLPELDRVLIMANPRVQFIGSGKSNPGQSAWCIWKKDRVGATTRIEWMEERVCKEWR